LKYSCAFVENPAFKGPGFQQPTQAKLKRNIYKAMGSLLPCGYIYLPVEDTEEPGFNDVKDNFSTINNK